MVYGV